MSLNLLKLSLCEHWSMRDHKMTVAKINRLLRCQTPRNEYCKPVDPGLALGSSLGSFWDLALDIGSVYDGDELYGIQAKLLIIQCIILIWPPACISEAFLHITFS